MALVEKTVLVPYTPEQMYDLVEGAERYPEFLPWCSQATVEHRDETITRATLHINYHGVKQNFSTENTKARPELIDIRLASGPFKRLHGTWRFLALGDQACRIEFRMEYEFSSRVLDKLVGPVFHHIANTFVDAFAKRAEKMYD